MVDSQDSSSTRLRSSYQDRSGGIGEEPVKNLTSRRFRAICGLLLHLVEFLANACFLYFSSRSNLVIFAILALNWFLVGSVCAWVAHRDETVLPNLPSVFRLPLVIVAYGFMQGMHVWNMGKGTLWAKNAAVASSSSSSYDSSSSTQQVRSMRFDDPTRPVNSKSFEAITESYVFAYTSVVIFLLSAAPQELDVPWESHIQDWRPRRWFLFGVAWLNMSASAIGIMEIDFRVGKLLRKQVNGSVLNCIAHFAFRLAEISSRILAVTIFVFTTMLLRRCLVQDTLIWMLLIFWHPLVIWVLHAQLLRHAVVPGAAKEPRLAHYALAYVVNITDPATFVDRAGYVAAARRFSGHLYTFRALEMATMFLVIGLVFWRERLDCFAEGEPATVGGHLLKYHWGILVAFLVILVVRLTTVFFFRGCFRLSHMPIVDDSVIQMKPAAHEREGSVRPLKPRGLSAMLFQVSTGLSFRIFYEQEKRFDDFVIESKLGCGNYGVVAKVTCEDDFGNPMVFAMKLQNTVQMEEDASDLLCSLEESAGRERDILLQLDHPFVTRLFYYFKVPATQSYRYASTGEEMVDKRESRCFHRAIIMEYLELGDLEQLILSHALTAQQRQAPRRAPSRSDSIAMADLEQSMELQTMEPPGTSFDNNASDSFAVEPGPDEPRLHAEEVTWLLLMRKFAAEMLLVLEFVHSKDILYRDLKPGNILLRGNRLGKLHVVLGDFGLSKQIQPCSRSAGGEGEGEAPTGEALSTQDLPSSFQGPTFGKLDSLAGTARFAAPEVLDIAHRKARRRYTPAVDLFSFGKTVLVMLWRSKVKESSRALLMPEPAQYMNAIDMPPLSHELIWVTTSRDAVKRGTASSQQKHPFFDGFRYGGASFPKIDFKSLPIEASDI